MRRGICLPHWYLLLVAVLGLELRRPPSDSLFRYFFLQLDVATLCLPFVNGRSPRFLEVQRTQMKALEALRQQHAGGSLRCILSTDQKR